MIRTQPFQLKVVGVLLMAVFFASNLCAQIQNDPQGNGSNYMYPVRTWEQQEIPHVSVPNAAQSQEDAVVAINRKLQRIILPKVEFHHTRLADAIEYLHQESIRLDSVSTSSERGVNISVPPPSVAKHYRDDDPYAEVQSEAPVILRSPYLDSILNLSLDRIPLLEAIRYMAREVNLKVRAERNAVYLESCNIQNQPTYVREYTVPTKFALLKFVSRDCIRAILEADGIDYPTGANAVYCFDKSRLVVRNSPENLDLIGFLFTEASVPTTPTPLVNP